MNSLTIFYQNILDEIIQWTVCRNITSWTALVKKKHVQWNNAGVFITIWSCTQCTLVLSAPHNVTMMLPSKGVQLLVRAMATAIVSEWQLEDLDKKWRNFKTKTLWKIVIVSRIMMKLNDFNKIDNTVTTLRYIEHRKKMHHFSNGVASSWSVEITGINVPWNNIHHNNMLRWSWYNNI